MRYQPLFVIISAVALLGAGCSSGVSVTPSAPTAPVIVNKADTNDSIKTETKIINPNPEIVAEVKTEAKVESQSVPVVPPPESISAVPAPSPASGAAPAEVKWLNVDVENGLSNFQIKILTDKTITQVDLANKDFDAKGALVGEQNYSWQNVVKSKVMPIVKDQTYKDHFFSSEETVRSEIKITLVHFADGTTWSPGK